MRSTLGKAINALTGIAGLPPALSAKRERFYLALAARCGWDARDPSTKSTLESKRHSPPVRACQRNSLERADQGGVKPPLQGVVSLVTPKSCSQHT